ncbi:MAG TPA: hypothetical protein ENN20_08740 [Candidatus Marinimicrobia bacterium]|nr:hypothetical protein [Candidatus Neomarinimicrobiota bacterium]
MNKQWTLLIICLIIILISSQSALAIPAFARRYKFSCNNCHDPFPRLKDYGDEFAGNGFIEPNEEKSRDYISAGDDKLWLNRDFTVGIRFDAYAMLETKGAIEKDLQTPYGLKLLSGGTLYKKIGYYFYFYIYERGEVAGLEDAYIHFDNVFNSKLDIMVGQFQTCDPLMKRELRLTYEDYYILKKKIGNSNTNLAYDRGVIFAYGIEKTGTDIVAMLTNGNGIPEAGNNHRFDSDPYKNVGLRVAQGIGENIGIGGFYYRGEEAKLNGATVIIATTNVVQYFGPDVVLNLGKLTFTGQYLIRMDSNPNFIANPDETQTIGICAELVFAPKYDQSDFYWTLLYNNIESDIAAHNYHTIALSGTYLMARNLRLIAEYIHDLEAENNLFILGLVSGF